MSIAHDQARHSQHNNDSISYNLLKISSISDFVVDMAFERQISRENRRCLAQSLKQKNLTRVAHLQWGMVLRSAFVKQANNLQGIRR